VPAADHAGVEEIEALLARLVDLPVGFADQHRLSLVDRDLMGTNLDLEGHDPVPQFA
jgi:hypothetical protein